MNTALSHLSVLDLADETASYCSKILAALGAAVIKVEKPGGDLSRNSLSFQYNNTGKKSITLNLETRKGRDIFRRLAASADVIIDTFPPDFLKRRRLDHDRLKILNPRLIMVSVTPFGQTGPQKSYKADDLVTSAAGGQMYLHGDPAMPPVKPYGKQSHYLASLFALSGILLAIQYRNSSGIGQFIDISLQEAAASSLVNTMVRLFWENTVPHSNGTIRWDNMAGIFPCRDGLLFLTFDREWETLMDFMAAEEFDPGLDSAEWADPDYRRQHSASVIETVGRWTSTHTVAELFELGQSMRFPWAPVENMAGLPENPQMKSSGFFSSVMQDETQRDFLYPGIPVKVSQDGRTILMRAPLYGEHNREIYNKMLGFSEKKIAQMVKNNVI